MPFKELLSLSLPPRRGEMVELVIERTDQSQESLSLTNELDQELTPQADGTWFLRGTAEEINAQLEKLTLRVPGDDHAIGTFALRTTATSELGNTGLRSEAVSRAVEFSLDPVATAPRWSQLTNEGADEALSLSRFGDYLAAEPVDPREQLVYVIQLPATDQELLVTDRSRRPHRNPGRQSGAPEQRAVGLGHAAHRCRIATTGGAAGLGLQQRTLHRPAGGKQFATPELATHATSHRKTTGCPDDP